MITLVNAQILLILLMNTVCALLVINHIMIPAMNVLYKIVHIVYRIMNVEVVSII